MTADARDAAAAPDDFILVVDDALDRASCARIVERLRASDALQPGRVGSGVMPALKRSRDLVLPAHPDWADVVVLLNRAVFAGLLGYLRRYPQALIAPLLLQQPGPDGQPEPLDAARIAAMDDAALAPLLQACLRPGGINLQWYSAGEGGYPYWHCELYPRDASCESLHRHLLWTLYLNDEFDAGETEFLFQKRRIVPRTGSLLIAPTAFTHTHRGNRPERGDKMIATSWVLFQRAEQLFKPG
jgi:hypothetical protein